MRYLKLMVVVLLSLVLIVPEADAARQKRSNKYKQSRSVAGSGTRDARYAELVVNPVTGEVYREASADARRYPASLTKMMTLYMLFEALEQNKVAMDTRMDVSSYAATMPQTNLALDSGDTIPVEVAIKALVVRSANDVAVVVGEALGGNVDNFADMMTEKAHALGMENTVFKNPNGLPNMGQYTTARDMAKLGIALKRDFPRYYRYFETRQFSWEGVTYYTHNRVMLRYQGTDGIKTGFIGASGFNLVTSVTRGGRPLVGVVLGGASGAWRDNRMISLLDSSYKTIASRGALRGRGELSNLPLPKYGNGNTGVGLNPAQAAKEVVASVTDVAIPENAESDDSAAAVAAVQQSFTAPDAARAPLVMPAPAPAAPVAPPTKIGGAESPLLTTKAAAPLSPSPFQVLNATPAKPQTGKLGNAKNEDLAWGIQVGAFSSHELAEQAAKQALQLATTNLSDSKLSVIGPEAGGATVHRARLENLSKTQAIRACEKLLSSNSPCFIYHAGSEKI